MKKVLLFSLSVVLLGLSFHANAQLLDKAKKILSSKSKGLSEQDAADGIREALLKGTAHGVETVSKADGYLGNPEIKIPLPPEASGMEKKLKSIGLGKQVDQVVVSLNRAAETAAVEAKPIFIAAIKNLTITDAVNIVKGNDDAATQYLEKSTSSELSQKFQPIIKSSLEKVNATKYWSGVMTTYNKIPFVKKINPDLNQYVTGKAIEGLFKMIAKEEISIRQDPAARSSDLLKKVFGK
jgi:hypothetical protein